jgi:hypothetical protein
VKVTVMLSPADVLALNAHDGGPSRAKFTIAFDGGALRADVAAKSVRKAQKTITDHGAENVFCMLQGKLGRGEITECGLVAQVKAPPTPAAES